jgi:hypothetical protein
VQRSRLVRFPPVIPSLVALKVSTSFHLLLVCVSCTCPCNTNYAFCNNAPGDILQELNLKQHFQLCIDSRFPKVQRIKLTIASMRTFLSLIAANEFKTKIMKAIQTITKKQTLPLTHLLYSTETLRRDNRNRLVYEGLANGLLVVAPTKATIDEAAYIQPTDSYYFHHRDDWAQVPLNNIMMVKEDRTEPGDVPQPKKQQVGSEWNWNHYVTVLPPGSNTATGRLEVMGRMCANINSTITEDNGYRFIKEFRVAEDKTNDAHLRPVDAVFFETDVIGFLAADYRNETLIGLAAHDDIVAKYFENIEEGKAIMTRYHNDQFNNT